MPRAPAMATPSAAGGKAAAGNGAGASGAGSGRGSGNTTASVAPPRSSAPPSDSGTAATGAGLPREEGGVLLMPGTRNICRPIDPDQPWYFTPAALKLSPSFRSSIRPDTERKYCRHGCEAIQSLVKAVLHQEFNNKQFLLLFRCTWTAVCYFQRYFTRRSFKDCPDRLVRHTMPVAVPPLCERDASPSCGALVAQVMAAACVMAAAKTLYCPKSLRDIVRIHIRKKDKARRRAPVPQEQREKVRRVCRRGRRCGSQALS